MHVSTGAVHYLIPAVGSVRGVDEQGDYLGLGQKRSSSLWGLLRGEIVCALLKKKVHGHIRGNREKVHVPETVGKRGLQCFQSLKVNQCVNNSPDVNT